MVENDDGSVFTLTLASRWCQAFLTTEAVGKWVFGSSPRALQNISLVPLSSK